MTNTYQPELGQMAFGQPWKEYKVPAIVEAALTYIAEELERVSFNLHLGGEYNNGILEPFANTGDRFKNDTFEVNAYSWGDDEQPFNFKWRDIEISWYKRLGRGMSANQDISPERASEMLIDCVESLRKQERDVLDHE